MRLELHGQGELSDMLYRAEGQPQDDDARVDVIGSDLTESYRYAHPSLGFSRVSLNMAIRFGESV